MKTLSVSALFFLITCGVLAQGSLTTGSAVSPDAERARLGTERANANSAFQVEEVACYQRFLVNRCLDDISERRREVVTDLRRQEIMLNENQRRTRGAAQLQKLEEAQRQRLQDESNQRPAAMLPGATQSPHAQIKQIDRSKAKSQEKSNEHKQLRRQQTSASRASERENKAAGEAGSNLALKQRQAEAAARKARRQAELAKQQKPPAKPLPLPTP